MAQIAASIIIILLTSFLFNRWMLENKIVKIPNLYFGFLFALIASPLIYIDNNIFTIISVLMMIMIYSESIKHGKSDNKISIFNSGFLLGLMIILDYTLAVFYILLLFSLIHYTAFSIRNILIQLLGGISSILLYFLFVEIHVLQKEIIYQPSANLDFAYLGFKTHPLLILNISGLIILSKYELYNNYYKKTESAKKAFSLLTTLFSIILFYSLFCKSLKLIPFLIIPAVIIITNYLIYIQQSKFRTFLLGLLIISFLLDFFLYEIWGSYFSWF